MKDLFINLRNRLGLTQMEFARAVGVSRVTVSRWENRKVRPNPLALRTLSHLSKNGSHLGFNPAVTRPAASGERHAKSQAVSTTLPVPEHREVRLTELDQSAGQHLSENRKRTEIFRKSPVFANLDRQYLAELSARFSERHLQAREFLFFAGDPVECCYLVASGMVKIVKHSASGTDFITSIFGPGEMFGSILLFTHKILPSSAQAIGETRVLMIKNRDFVAFLSRHPRLSARIFQEMLTVAGQRHQAAMVRLGELAAERTGYRLARVLVGLCLRLGPDIPLTRHEIAEMSGTTTETTARFISRLTQTGIVQSLRGKIIVIDQSRLRQLAEAS